MSKTFLFSSGQDSQFFLIWSLLKTAEDNTFYLSVNHRQQIDSFETLIHLLKLHFIYQTIFIFIPLVFYNTDSRILSENELRIVRYLTTCKIQMFYNKRIICTGHTKSDLVESLFFNLIRGSGMRGLIGQFKMKSFLVNSFSFNYFNYLLIPSSSAYLKKKVFIPFFLIKKQKIVLKRPLVNTSRSTISLISKNFCLPLFVDQTNTLFFITRNKIRRHLLLYIQVFLNKKFESLIVESIFSFSFSVSTSFFNTLILAEKENIVFHSKKLFFCHLYFFQTLSNSVQKEFFYFYLNKQGHYSNTIKLNLYYLLFLDFDETYFLKYENKIVFLKTKIYFSS